VPQPYSGFHDVLGLGAASRQSLKQTGLRSSLLNVDALLVALTCCCCSHAAMLLVVLQVDVLQARLCQLLGRSLYIDEATAKFYLEDAEGDMKAAMEAFGETPAGGGGGGGGGPGWGGGGGGGGGGAGAHIGAELHTQNTHTRAHKHGKDVLLRQLQLCCMSAQLGAHPHEGAG